MPRRNRVRRAAGSPAPAPPPLTGGWQRLESAPDGDWLVRRVTGTGTTKLYRCPGCDQEIRPGTAHVVVWPADETGGIADRRHWHEACWTARGRRGPTSRRW
ncbi:hypothetical protein [Actinophytocola xanthii]|uniref:ATP/GTP-binding protein n=1 Tax=Actinophytocola xanthii TaxID=1912961 RepID=A0A1Q8CWC3_9PSEU|nr:hypothetical protein BU204_05175 [Actinophytocola xanthii]